ncbi:MAG: hypothetical protein IT380_14215 [Myxococcales bacterium]|nr:hypothetical protein [Myxococcales bacterium]
MSPLLKVLLAAAGVTIGACLASLVSLGILAGSTSRMGASEVGPVLLVGVALEAAFFLGGSGLIFFYAGKVLTGSARWAVPISHGVFQLGLWGVFAFGSLVAFNR